MSTAMPATSMRAGRQAHGFAIRRVTELPDLRAVAVEARHRRSGARLLHLHANDPENLFAIAFRTPPADNSGLPHILEHTVLCGSRRYPVKDPFVELLKTSLATFLNAMTYPDRTVYPCASMNRRDFFNLAGVYCDAVFHPRLTEAHFKQEGHHFDFAAPGDPDRPLIVKGIVYNEMKGHYSTLDGLMERAAEGLFPDNAYGFDSGGSPDAIPDLTYARFLDFHARYYHPSNARIFLYGDIPTEPLLDVLNSGYLRFYRRIAIDTSIAPQPRWTEPKSLTVDYPGDPGDTPERKSAFTMAWMTNPLIDAAETVTLSLLGEYLLGHSGSPLRKALVDSKLGEDVTFEGYFPWRRDTSFGVGLKGTGSDKADAIRRLVLDTCRSLADRGLERGPLESCFHQFELATRDIPANYPLVLMDRVFNSWIYDADPLALLRAREHVAEVRRRYESEPGYFEGRLRKWIVDNPHCLRMTFIPDPGLTARREEERARRWAGVKSGLSRPALESIAKEARELEALQSAPNTPEALATLPRLRRSDVSPEPMKLDTAVSTAGGRPLLRTDLFCNGLCFLHVAIDLRGVGEDLVDCLPLFAEALCRMGAAGLDYAAMAERESSVCGGVSAGVGASGRFDDPGHVQPFLTIGASALEERASSMADVFADRLLKADFTDLARLRDIVIQGAVRWRNAIVPAGSTFACSYAQRGLSRNAGLTERLGGLTQARFMRRLAANIDTEATGIVEKLERLRAFLLARPRVYGSFAGADDAWRGIEQWFGGLAGALADGPVPELPSDIPAARLRSEAVVLPSEVAFVARAMPAVGANDPRSPALLLLATQLSFAFLWNEVRVKGGAYGCHARYDQGLGLFTLSSYRDPAVRETLEVYERVPDHVAHTMDLSPEAVEQAVIGTLKHLDRPIRPSSAAGIALSRYLGGTTDEARRLFRGRLLALTAEEIRTASEEILRTGLREAPVCVIGGRERLPPTGVALPGGALGIEEF